MESRIKIILTIGLICMISHSMSAKETSWIGSNGKWEDPDSWSNGVPEAGDSAYISGNVQVEILMGIQAEVRLIKVSNGAVLIVRDEAGLQIDGGGSDGIELEDDYSTLRVEGDVHLVNGGIYGLRASDSSEIIIAGFLHIEDCNSGLRLTGGAHLYNEGDIQILNTSSTGMSFSGSSFENDGLIVLDTTSTGIALISRSTGVNTNSINISNCHIGISVRHSGLFTNSGQVSIDQAVFDGVRTYGMVNNSGTITIDNVGNPGNQGKAFNIDSFACCDTVYLGVLINTGSIEIGFCQGDCVYLDNSTSLQNSGLVQMTNCTKRGNVIKARSTFLLGSSGEITQGINGEEGLLVEEEAILQVDPGGLMNIN